MCHKLGDGMEINMSEILKELPAVILRGSVLLPGVVSHFDISARKSIHAVEEAMNGDNCIFLVTQKIILILLILKTMYGIVCIIEYQLF